MSELGVAVVVGDDAVPKKDANGLTVSGVLLDTTEGKEGVVFVAVKEKWEGNDEDMGDEDVLVVVEAVVLGKEKEKEWLDAVAEPKPPKPPCLQQLF